MSLHIPDLTEQWGELVVVHSPGSEHLCVVVAECSQLRQTTQEASKVLRLLWVLHNTQLLQHVQDGLLKILHSLLVLHIRPVWRDDYTLAFNSVITKYLRIIESCCHQLTWCQDGDGGEESLFLLHHVEFTDAFVEVEHWFDEFL